MLTNITKALLLPSRQCYQFRAVLPVWWYNPVFPLFQLAPDPQPGFRQPAVSLDPSERPHTAPVPGHRPGYVRSSNGSMGSDSSRSS